MSVSQLTSNEVKVLDGLYLGHSSPYVVDSCDGQPLVKVATGDESETARCLDERAIRRKLSGFRGEVQRNVLKGGHDSRGVAEGSDQLIKFTFSDRHTLECERLIKEINRRNPTGLKFIWQRFAADFGSAILKGRRNRGFRIAFQEVRRGGNRVLREFEFVHRVGGAGGAGGNYEFCLSNGEDIDVLLIPDVVADWKSYSVNAVNVDFVAFVNYSLAILSFIVEYCMNNGRPGCWRLAICDGGDQWTEVDWWNWGTFGEDLGVDPRFHMGG